MRCWERMLRRAAIPFHSTAGFNPKPRLVFALSLGLGIVGCREVVELELDADLPSEEVHQRLARQAPAGLEILEVRRIEPKTTAQVRRVTYRLSLLPVPLAGEGVSLLSSPVAGEGPAVRGLPARVADLLAAEHLWVERTHPQPRHLDLRPYIDQLRLLPEALEMDLWVTPNGTARPDEVLGLLGLGDLLPQGAVIERCQMELLDEMPPAAAARTTTAKTDRDDAIREPAGTASGRPTVAAEPRPVPLIPGPLDY
jgi:radical SAM-linked protein